MAKEKTYGEKLKDPRWQKMRLEVMQRDGFKCANCNSAENTLHVHHKFYVYGNEPWEYELVDLLTLCEICHEDEEFCKHDFNITVKHLLRQGKSYRDLMNHILQILEY